MVTVEARRDFEFRSPEYVELFARSAATAFQHPIWLDRLYGVLAPAFEADPLILTAADDGGRLLLVLPLLRRRRAGLRTIEFADLGVTDYAAPVCSIPDYEAIRSDTPTLAELRRKLGPFDVLRIAKQRADNPDIAALLLGSRALPMSGHAHSVTLGPSWPDWREQAMDPSYRRELDRKRRKLDRAGELRLVKLSEAAAIEAAFATSLALRRPRFVDRDTEDILAHPAAMRFYVEVASAGAASGFAQTYALTLDGALIATLFGLAHAGRLMVLLTAFDAAYKRRSLGSLLFEDVIADRIRAGDTVFDLTVGDEGYKQIFGAAPTDLVTVLGSGSLLGEVARIALSRPGTLAIAKGLPRLRPGWLSGRSSRRPGPGTSELPAVRRTRGP